jgi:P4 family phage/plasmid primase-like protien
MLTHNVADSSAIFNATSGIAMDLTQVSGIGVFPCRLDNKAPLTSNGFKDASTDPEQIRAWWTQWPDALVGVPTGVASGIDALDVDPRHCGDKWLREHCTKLPDTRIHKTRGGGWHLLFKAHPDLRNSAGRIAEGVDVRATGGYIVWWPAEREHGISDWPEWLIEKAKKPKDPEAATSSAGLQSNLLDVAAALAAIPNDAKEHQASWDDWNKVAMALHAATGGSELGYGLFLDWSSKHPTFNEAKTREKWNQLTRCPPEEIGAGTIFYIAKQVNPNWQIPSRRKPEAQHEFTDNKGAPPPPPDVTEMDFEAESDDRISPAYSQDYIALQFTHQHGDRLQYVHKWGQWLLWDGRKWEVDETHRAFGLMRILCRDIARSANGTSDPSKQALASRSTARNALELAGADRTHAATVDQWDEDPWLLNTPAGIVDLRTGRLSPHDPQQFMTKITAVAPGGGCPMWLAFLDAITGGDKDFQGFLQRLFGHCLTGDTSEHIFPYGFGKGRNGKSVMLDTVASIMADYATAAPPDTFTLSHNEKHPTEMARLRGARLVTGSETEEGKKWNVTRIKQLTGASSNTKIPARLMRQDFFEFVPQCKIFNIGNTKPRLGRVDQAIRDRFLSIPFTVYFPPEKQDKHLADKLKAEWSGILAWMIEGCLEWQKNGLNPPEIILNASRDYLDTEDRIGCWINEQCEVGPDKGESSSRLYSAFRQWALGGGEAVMSQKAFSGELSDRGFDTKHTKAGNVVVGIEVKPWDSGRSKGELPENELPDVAK